MNTIANMKYICNIAALLIVFLCVPGCNKQSNNVTGSNQDSNAAEIIIQTTSASSRDSCTPSFTPTNGMGTCINAILERYGHGYTCQVSFSEYSNSVVQMFTSNRGIDNEFLVFLATNIFANGVKPTRADLLDYIHNQNTNYPMIPAKYLYPAALSIRYRSLLPHAAMKMLSQATNTTVARRYAGYISTVHHPDTIRLHLELNRFIGKDSPLRSGDMPVWREGLPIYYRQDCLPVYLDISRHPDNYTYEEWVTAHSSLQWFTNSEAVTELRRGDKTLKEWKKYWPDHNPGTDVHMVDSEIDTQRNIIDGKRPPPVSKPLLDE